MRNATKTEKTTVAIIATYLTIENNRNPKNLFEEGSF